MGTVKSVLGSAAGTASPMPNRVGKLRRSLVLFRFALLLLSDADLEVLLLGFLERFMIVARHRIGQILIHISALRENHHDREGLIASRAERSKPFDIGNCHNNFRLSQLK
jgi:hypothetical protein